MRTSLPYKRGQGLSRLLRIAVLLALTVVPTLSALVAPTTVRAINDIVTTETSGTTVVNESGSTDTFGVVLSNAPISNVVLAVTSSDTGEATVSPSNLTFTPSNWNTPQTVTVTGVDDAIADGSQSVSVVLSVIDSLSDNTYDGKSAVVSVTVTDNEPAATPGFLVIESNGETRVSEAGTTDTFTAVLTKQPTSNVTISITSGDATEVAVSPTSLLFTQGNWNTAQTVTVTGQDDAIADGDQNTPIVLSVVDAVSANEYDAVPDQTVNVVTQDNEVPTPGIIVAETDGNTTVSESGTTDTFTVVLTKQPTSNVSISVTSGDVGETTVSPATLTFTQNNWSTAQTVTTTGVDDALSDGAQVTPVVLSVVDTLSADEYDPLPDQTVNVTTTDNEPPAAGFSATESSGNTTVSESGTTDTFTVVLTKQPGVDVVLSVTSADTGEVSVSPGSLTYTPSNWNVSQTVTVTGVDDSMSDGNQNTAVVLSVVDALSDNEYDPLPDQAMNVTTIDNEVAVPGFSITESGGSTIVHEPGTTDTIAAVLTSQPTNDVVISITSSDTTEATVSPSQLTFTPANWNTAQTVTVTGVDDPFADGDQVTTIILSIVDALSAQEYRTVADQTVSVTTVDNEPPLAGFTITETGGSTVVNESGTTDTFAVVLNKQPASNVVISVTSTDTTEVTVSPSSLTFTQQNWNAAQTVTVRGVDDGVRDGDQETPVTLSVVDALSDDQYDPVPDQSARVTTVDNEPRPGPILASPPDGAHINNLGPVLRWSQEAGTTWFQVQVIPVNDDGPGINLIIGETLQVAASQYQVKEPDFGSADPNYVMLPDITYTWRIRTATTLATPMESDWTAWSTPRTFHTVSKSSGTISRVSPAEGSTVSSRNPTLVWTNSDETVFYYEVQVSKDPSFGNTPGSPFLYWELRHGGLTNPLNSYTIPDRYPLEGKTTYYWRVRPRIQGDGIPVPWSSTFSFRTP